MQQYIACVASWFPSESGGGSSSAAAAAAAAADSSGAGGGELSFGAAGVSTMGAIGLDGRCVRASWVAREWMNVWMNMNMRG